MLVACLIFLCASPAFAQHPKLAADLDDSKSSAMVDVIVQYNQVPTQKHFDNVRGRGGSVKRHLGQFKGAAFSVPAAALQDLANDPDVTYISPDRKMSASSYSSNGTVTDF